MSIEAEAARVHDNLQTSLTRSLSATKILAFVVNKYGVPQGFDSLAQDILSSHPSIDALQLTKGGLITHVYPLTGNEASIGYDILADSARRQEAMRAIERRALYFAGPFKLRQGPMGIVGRLPMFEGDNFVGFAVVIIHLQTLISTAGIDTTKQSLYRYQLSKVDPVTGAEQFFLPGGKPTDANHSRVDVPDGSWILYIESKETGATNWDAIGFSILGALLSTVSALLVWLLARQRRRLHSTFTQRTARLREVEQDFKTTLERVTDGFIAYDANWNYTYINKRASELLQLEPVDLLGKNIWKEFPELKQQPIYEAYHRASRTQQYESFESFLPSAGRWLENQLYPSRDGLSVFFRDTTEARNAKINLEASEKYFRALIEKSNDAIVLLDRDRRVLYQTPSATKISGYSLREIQNLNVMELMHPEERAAEKEAFDEVLRAPNATLTRTRRFRHKKGNYSWHECTYTNLLSDPNVRAVVCNFHDCSVRMDAEAKMLKASRLFHFISRVNKTIVHVRSEEELFRQICDIAVTIGQFKMAWFGRVNREREEVVAWIHAGEERDYLRMITPLSLDPARGPVGPTATAVNNASTFVCNDIENDSRMIAWKFEALSRGYCSSIALPIRVEGQVIGVFSLYAPDPDFFDQQEVDLLEETTSELAFILTVLKKNRA